MLCLFNCFAHVPDLPLSPFCLPPSYFILLPLPSVITSICHSTFCLAPLYCISPSFSVTNHLQHFSLSMMHQGQCLEQVVGCPNSSQLKPVRTGITTSHVLLDWLTETHLLWLVTHILPTSNGSYMIIMDGVRPACKNRFSICWQSCKFGNKCFCKHRFHHP